MRPIVNTVNSQSLEPTGLGECPVCHEVVNVRGRRCCRHDNTRGQCGGSGMTAEEQTSFKLLEETINA